MQSVPAVRKDGECVATVLLKSWVRVLAQSLLMPFRVPIQGVVEGHTQVAVQARLQCTTWSRFRACVHNVRAFGSVLPLHTDLQQTRRARSEFARELLWVPRPGQASRAEGVPCLFLAAARAVTTDALARGGQ